MERSKVLNKNLKLYELIRLVTPLTMWGVTITLFYRERGLDFGTIALIQSIGAVFSMVIDIPTGVLADRLGDKFFLVLSRVFNIIACVLMVFAHSFTMFLLAEFAFGIGFACLTGAQSSFFYKNLRELGRLDEYRSLISKFNRRAIPVRMVSLFLAPILYNFWSESVFLVSAVVYAVVLIFYLQYDESYFTKATLEKEKKKEMLKINEKLTHVLAKYKNFIILSVLSLIFITIVSNFFQFFSNQVSELGFKISLLGILFTLREAVGYFSNMIAPRIKKEHTWTFLFLLPLLLALLLVFMNFFYNVYTVIFVFFLADIIMTPFMVLLGEKIHQSVDDRNRNTMLAVAEQFENFGALIFDPIIGVSIDKIGFRLTYFYMGLVFSLLLVAIYIYFKEKVI